MKVTNHAENPENPSNLEEFKIINGQPIPVECYFEEGSSDSSLDLDVELEEFIKETGSKHERTGGGKVMGTSLQQSEAARGNISNSLEDLSSDSASSSVLEYLLSKENHLSGLDLERIYRCQKEALEAEDSGSELSFSANEVFDATLSLYYVSHKVTFSWNRASICQNYTKLCQDGNILAVSNGESRLELNHRLPSFVGDQFSYKKKRLKNTRGFSNVNVHTPCEPP